MMLLFFISLAKKESSEWRTPINWISVRTSILDETPTLRIKNFNPWSTPDKIFVIKNDKIINMWMF